MTSFLREYKEIIEKYITKLWQFETWGNPLRNKKSLKNEIRFIIINILKVYLKFWVQRIQYIYTHIHQ